MVHVGFIVTVASSTQLNSKRLIGGPGEQLTGWLYGAGCQRAISDIAAGPSSEVIQSWVSYNVTVQVPLLFGLSTTMGHHAVKR
jgi:hypothetical protein